MQSFVLVEFLNLLCTLIILVVIIHLKPNKIDLSIAQVMYIYWNYN